jgi:2-dehydro-3-deoxyglucarate aldolase/4-hydroxy-2-oxoheptanedioate aldolase
MSVNKVGSANTVKARLKAGDKTAGAFLQLTSNISAEIMARAGFDWLMIDMEHAPGDYANLLLQQQAMQGTGVIPFVRAAANDAVAIKKILDTGTQGVLIPHVNNRAEAEHAVAACKYPPLGIRGAAGSPRAAGYGQNVQQYLAQANDDIAVVVAVETPEAVDNIDAIVEVPDLDGIFIGPMDLATSMGFPGEPGRPEVKQAIECIEAAVLASDKFLGTVTSHWEQAERLYQRGYQWLVLMQDTTALAAMGAEVMARFHQLYGAR